MDTEEKKEVESGDSQLQQEEIEKIKKERDEYLDGWKRAMADFSNYKKDEFKRIESVLKLSNEQLIKDLLPVLDSFDLALESLLANQSDAKIEKGVYLIRSQFEDVLKKYGLERITAPPGTPFNPAVHDAVVSVEGKESGTIAEEVERGYMLGGKIIRPVRVKVVK